MKKNQLIGLLTMAGVALTLASCQIAPVNATTKINSVDGAGSKTISMLVLVDGSCQIQPDTTSFVGNNNYFYIGDATFEDIKFTPKEDGAKVKLVLDGYLTNPNKLDSNQKVWDEFNEVVKSYIPEGFTFNCREVKSDDWNDDYMTNVPGADVTAWKGYVYSVSYSWDNVTSYIEKTKALIGQDAYAISHLQELDDASTPWAKFTKNEDNTYTWEEAYLVNYWSVYGVADKVLGSKYFNKAALGADYAITTDNAFSIALQEYQIGDGDKVIVKIDNQNGVDENQNPKFISATGTIKATETKDDSESNKKGCKGSASAGFISLLALAGLALKRRKN